jgi:hypothetical protein
MTPDEMLIIVAAAAVGADVGDRVTVTVPDSC